MLNIFLNILLLLILIPREISFATPPLASGNIRAENISNSFINTGSMNIINEYFMGSEQHKRLNSDIEKFEILLREAQNEGDQKKITEISTKLNNLINQKIELEREIIIIYNTLKKVPLNTERLKKAKALFKQGKINEANKTLDLSDLEKDQKFILSQKIKYESALKDNSNEYLFKAVISSSNYSNKNWFDETINLFESSLKSDRNSNNLSQYAFFLKEQYNYRKALELYKEAVVLLENEFKINKGKDDSNIILFLNNIGVLYYELGDRKSAEEYYSRASVYLEDLLIGFDSDNTPKFYSIMIGNNELINKFNWLKMNDDFARHVMLEVEIRNLVEKEPNKYNVYLGIILNNYAIFSQRRGHENTALNYYEEALEIFGNLKEKEGYKYTPHLATVYNNRGSLYYNYDYMGKYTRNEPDIIPNYGFEITETSYEKSLEIYKELVKINPDRYNVFIGDMFYNLGILSGHLNDFNSAIDYYQKALKIYKESSETNFKKYDFKIAETLMNIGASYYELNNSGKAIAYYEKSFEVCNKLDKKYYVKMNLENIIFLYSDSEEDELLLNLGSYEDLFEELKENPIDKLNRKAPEPRSEWIRIEILN